MIFKVIIKNLIHWVISNVFGEKPVQKINKLRFLGGLRNTYLAYLSFWILKELVLKGLQVFIRSSLFVF
tara:strand:+ start:389 stop:595 length:207 start_codon:yes stop_codon:yes gene_type:complete